MTTITNAPAVTQTATANTGSSAARSSARIADNFDQFLSLLTTQLKNQSPLDPLDTNQFTQQLVQFAGVEQQINTNKLLETLSGSLSGPQGAQGRLAMLSNAVGYIGTKISADGQTSFLQNGSASWSLESPLSAEAVVTIADKTGATVMTKKVALGPGRQDFVWDGKDVNGRVLPNGEYRITVSAKRSTGETVPIKTDVAGTVTAIDVSGQEPVLKIGNISVLLSAVKSVSR